MTGSGLAIIFGILLVGCAADSPLPEAQTPSIRSAMYQRGDGGDTVECQGLPVRNVCGSEQWPSLLYFDCSDDQYDCVFDTHEVLAMPKETFALGQRFSAFGADLVVKRCYGLEGRCDVALVTSSCSDAKVCNCRFNGMAPSSTTFVYSREKGVTAFYTLKSPKELADMGVDSEVLADTLPLLTFVLVAEKGFLSEKLALARATLHTDCRR